MKTVTLIPWIVCFAACTVTFILWIRKAVREKKYGEYIPYTYSIIMIAFSIGMFVLSALNRVI